MTATNKPEEEYEIGLCDKCIQSTNHLNGICQKCLPKRMTSLETKIEDLVRKSEHRPEGGMVEMHTMRFAMRELARWVEEKTVVETNVRVLSLLQLFIDNKDLIIVGLLEDIQKKILSTGVKEKDQNNG